ncbi:MAG: redoxin domain-containing protein [Ferruginibacter sp.]|nr:redoxin domain-containing protein [Ferruginibacter sp.]
MKKLSILAAFITGAIMVQAQIDSSAKNLSKFEKIPSFNMYIVPDSTSFSNKNLKTNKSFIIMFFSPDCEHCQKETRELLAYKNELKNIQILMASPSSYGMVKQFYEEYNLASMPNIKLGNDVNYALGCIYQLRTFPSIFVYDRTGKLAKAFVGNIGVPAILEALK